MEDLFHQEEPIMAYFGKRSKLSHCQLNRAAVVLDLPCDPDTLRRLARANQLICRNSVRPALGPDRYQVLSRSRGDQWYNVYLSIYDARWGCTCRDFRKRQPAVSTYHLSLGLSTDGRSSHR